VKEKYRGSDEAERDLRFLRKKRGYKREDVKEREKDKLLKVEKDSDAGWVNEKFVVIDVVSMLQNEDTKKQKI